ncbi:hypothetical protein BDU57DRAFT_523433 [Ampelomyces quisqualis]|uniref:Uncharacterized protein n=1 Tax=Ampelomyces quisqualis TaxID=50730 RepID=A0A6A5Q8U0_AMPQU|nr:hypothetical protein BDU57DRAFT_523433 [Ampelomyces quisqualis]
MARLAFPPTLTRIAACASTTIANPAARISIQQRAPIQSAASRTIKASVARPSLILSGAPRTTLRAAATALQRAQSTRDELAAASKTIPAGACIRALHGKKIVNKTPANNDQNKNEQTDSRIPKPKSANNMQMKARQRVTLVYKKIDKNKEKEIVKNISHENAVTYVDNNSDLLEDVSFDESIPAGVQSHYTHYFSRMDLRIQTCKQGGRIARVPRYGGDFITMKRD